MKIEEVEELEKIIWGTPVSSVGLKILKALESLRAEAWHPIEKAAELGALDNRDVLIHFRSWGKYLVRVAKWDSIVKGWLIHGDFCINDGVTHFRFINPPEN